MDNINNIETAWTPSFGMPTGYPCARMRAIGAGAVAKDVAVAVRVQTDFWGSPAWRPLTS